MRKHRYSVVLRREKNVAFSEDTCLEKERMRSKVNARKAGMGLNQKRGFSKRGGAGG